MAERIYFVLSSTPIKKGNIISFEYTPRDKVTNATLRNSGIRCRILESISLMGINGEMTSYDIFCPYHNVGEDIVTREQVEEMNGHSAEALEIETAPQPSPVKEAIATTEPLE